MECIFCKIVRGELESRIVYQNEAIIAFHDINPQAPFHILLIPREHISTTNDLDDTNASVVGELFLAARKIAAENGFDEKGYRLVMNCNRDAGQTVYHIHLHLLAGRHLHWPPG